MEDPDTGQDGGGGAAGQSGPWAALGLGPGEGPRKLASGSEAAQARLTALLTAVSRHLTDCHSRLAQATSCIESQQALLDEERRRSDNTESELHELRVQFGELRSTTDSLVEGRALAEKRLDGHGEEITQLQGEAAITQGEVVELRASVSKVEGQCTQLAEDAQAMASEIRAESEKVQRQVAEVADTLKEMQAVPKRLDDLQAVVERIGTEQSSIASAATHALHAVVADRAALETALEDADAEGVQPPEVSQLLPKASATAYEHLGGLGAAGGSGGGAPATTAPVGGGSDNVAAAGLHEHVESRLAGWVRLHQRMFKQRADLQTALGAGSAERERAENAENELQRVISEGLVRVQSQSEKMGKELGARMVAIEHLNALQQQMDLVTAAAGGASDEAKAAVNDAREAMRIAYDLNKKVDEADGKEVLRKLETVEAETRASLAKLVGRSELEGEIEKRLVTLKTALKDKAGADETRRAMSLLSGLSERVDTLSSLREGLADVAKLATESQLECQRRLMAVEGTILDKADQMWLEEMEARLRAEMAALGGEDEVEDTSASGSATATSTSTATATATAEKPKRNGAQSVSRREFERKLASLRNSLSELAAGGNQGNGAAATAAAAALAAWMPGSAAFRCLACDAPLAERVRTPEFGAMSRGKAAGPPVWLDNSATSTSVG